LLTVVAMLDLAGVGAFERQENRQFRDGPVDRDSHTIESVPTVWRFIIRHRRVGTYPVRTCLAGSAMRCCRVGTRAIDSILVQGFSPRSDSGGRLDGTY